MGKKKLSMKPQAHLVLIALSVISVQAAVVTDVSTVVHANARHHNAPCARNHIKPRHITPSTKYR